MPSVASYWNPRFAELVPMYNEPHRVYHTMHHINTMLHNLQESAAWHTISCDAVRAAIVNAIWYHDAYFSVCAANGDSERMSVEIFRHHNAVGTQTSILATEMILLTAHHAVDIDIPSCISTMWPAGNVLGYVTSDRDVLRDVELGMSLFLDLDMAGFGKSSDYQYDIAEKQIEDEYSICYAPTEFLAGRIMFLNALLKRKRLYYTDEFAAHEQLARQRISGSIKKATEMLAKLHADA